MYGKQIVNHIGALGSKVRNYLESGRVSRAAKAIDSIDPVSIDLSGEVADSQIVPAGTENACTNCGLQLEGLYCSACGQRDRDMQRPFWFLFADLGDEIFAWDSRFLQTLGPLLFLPGALTRGFWDGKRSAYVPPIRLYLLCSLFFFLVVAVADVAILKFSIVPTDPDQVNSAEVVKAKAEAAEQLRAAGMPVPPELEVDVIAPDSEAGTADAPEVGGDGDGRDRFRKTGNNDIRVTTDAGEMNYGFDVQMFAPIEDTEITAEEARTAFEEAHREIADQRNDATEIEGILLAFSERVLNGLERVAEDPGRLNNALNNWIPLTMVVLLPVFAIILRVFYWGKKQRLIKQLVFSLHFHSYIFLILALLIIAQKAWGTAASSWMFFAAVPLYLFLGLRTASQQGWIRTFFKFWMISLVYMILLTITVTTAVLMSLSEI